MRGRVLASPGAPAIFGLDRDSVSFRLLLDQVERTVRALNSLGIGRGDRVAIVLPNGPELAVCCFAVSAAASSAPLNPAYSAAEFKFFLGDLKPEALIVSDLRSSAADVARTLEIALLKLTYEPNAPAGVFTIEGEAVRAAAHAGFAEPDDVALLLHTSGSTSRPKLVPLTHANLLASAANIAAALALTPGDRCLNIMPLFHIHGLIGAVLASLSAGAAVACTPGFHAQSFFDWLDHFQPTWYTAVPTMHQAILSRAPQHAASLARARLRFIRSSSSALPPRLMAEMEQVFGAPMLEAYGMTEASHQMAVNPLPPGERKPGSVGRGAGVEIAILGIDGSPLATGEIGEIAIRGPNVTQGYESNPEANRAAFTPEAWFRTGDQGRLDADGYLFLTGRSKEIINRGGEKISPREVDEVLLDHPAVAAALTFAMPDARLGEDVAAAIVLHSGASTTAAELCEFAAGRLADFKVPRRIVFLDELPKGPTGKPQRIGLAEKLGVLQTATPDARPFAEPRTEAEKKLAAIWAQVLGADRVGLHDDFFQLGGDSILATQVIARVRDEFGVELPMFRLFGSPSVEPVAAWLEDALKDAAHPIRPFPRSGPVPLSYAQQRMWFLTQLEEATPAYVIPMAVRLRGPLRVDVLESAFSRVIERHEVLRTTFPVHHGMPMQDILPAVSVRLPIHECLGVPPEERDTLARNLARVESETPLDISRERPIRTRLVRFADDDHLLLITIHHIASDGWSKSILFRELDALYAAGIHGKLPDLPALPIQYADFAQFRRQQMESPIGEKLLEYWKNRLAGAPELLDLPADRPRPPRQSFAGGLTRMLVPPDLAEALRALGHRESVTLYMTLLAAFQALLSRYSGHTDICVGTPAASRLRKETESLIGSFVNTLAMRTDLSGDPAFRQLLSSVRDTALGAFDHQDLPLEKLIEALQPQRSLSYPPLFQVLFQLRNFPEIATCFEGLDAAPIEFDPGTAQFDLTLEITEVEDGLACVLNYNSALFDEATAVRMLGHYQTLLEAAAADPEIRLSRLPLLTAGERRQVLHDWNQTGVDYPRTSVVRLFEEQAARTPQAVAVRNHEKKWTYGELNWRADNVAAALRKLGVQPGSLVAVQASRSLEMLAGLLGIWKAGAGYVPLDPSYPRERREFILEDSGAVVLLTDFGPAFVARARPGLQATGDLAYLIYTSGSSGKPKGVAIRQAPLVNVLCALQRRLEVSARDTLLALTTIAFDISTVELFMPLISGASVYLAGRDAVSDGEKLSRAIEASGATIVQATPATWRVVMDSGWSGKSGLKIVSGGEALPRALAERLLEHAQVWNGYGPTETTVYSTISELRPGESLVPIGGPIDNTHAYVLDSNLEPVPVGVPGELYIGGEGLAEGYWKRPDLTAERFVPDPFAAAPDARLYRTGDLVRWLPSGELEFLRRADNQVKLRGFRIELEEIEHLLGEHPDVNAASVKLIEAAPGDHRLAAFYTVRNGTAPSESDLREFLAAKLPGYMLPAVLTRVAALPLTPNGKVDRKALALPGGPANLRHTAARGPSTVNEMVLLEIWEDILGRRPIGVTDDFFALGGHSLLGARMLAGVEQAFGVRLPLSAFFEAPTVAEMAARLGDRVAAAGSRILSLRSGGAQVPLVLLHPGPYFRPLMLGMPDTQPILGLTVFDASGITLPCGLEHLAARQVEALRRHQPEGPYLLAGWCADGVLAYEMARQMTSQGASVPLVIMIDSFNPGRLRGMGRWKAASIRAGAQVNRARFHLANALRLTPSAAAAQIRQTWRSSREERTPSIAEQTLLSAVQQYDPRPYSGTVLLFRPQDRPRSAHRDAAHGWRDLIKDLEVVDVPGDHHQMLADPNVRTLVAALATRLSKVAPRISHDESLSAVAVRYAQSEP